MAIYARTGISSIGQVVATIRQSGLLSAPFRVLFWFEVSAPFWLARGVALFGLRCVPPRPRRSRIVRMPGTAALVAATFCAAAVFGAWLLVGYPLYRLGKLTFQPFPLSTQYPLILRVMLVATVAVGAAVAGAWGIVLMGRRVPGESDWIEWAGRVLGILLLLSTPFYLWAALTIY